MGERQVIPHCEAAFSYALENNLRTQLFTTNSYNRFTRPLAQVPISAKLSLLTLTSLSIKDQSMLVAGYFTFTWSDNRLNWTADATYNADIIAFYTTQDYVWIPSLAVTNSISDIAVISDNTFIIRVAMDGTLTWTPGGIYETSCTTDVTYYPFDTQTCSLTLTTWGYTNVEIGLSGSEVDITYYEANGEWDYSSYAITSTTRLHGGNSLPQVNFNLTFKRRPTFQVMNTIVPMILLASLSCFVFQLPPDSGEKMGYSLTTLLAFAVYLTLVSANIPTTSINTACLSVYLIIMLAWGVMAVILTIYVLKCHHSPPEKPIPNYLRKFCFVAAKLGCFHNSCFNRKNAVGKLEKGEEAGEVNKTQIELEPELTWPEVTMILDNFFFKWYALVLGSVTLCVLLTLMISYYT
ncbi:acetylcholine receptor subunit beta-like isoform X2 [Ostrea edulis]|uniref:acetylcholine receptor subunit beta-like isoform X2 n=1 Tax=Ostrea edulis TaxID=37623 RepID=UPI0024AFFFF5|nr:acetylcholine receptor subunit beta-like isoform X2 [Ostrea edulis]